jgi:DNA polymerase-1
MSVLELARKTYTKLKAERNGHAEPRLYQCAGYEINELNEINPPHPPGFGYTLVEDAAGLGVVAAALEKSGLVAVDLETTGLDPRKDQVRLLCVAPDAKDGRPVGYLVDCFRVDPAPLLQSLAEKELVCHNAAFELSFLAVLGFSPGAPVHDTMLLAQLLAAGTFERANLSACCERYLHRPLDKDEQRSDWSGDLSPEQLDYAAGDVRVLLPLLEALDRKVREAGLCDTAAIERRCLPALVWMASKGVAFNVDASLDLAEKTEEQRRRIRAELDAAAPLTPGSLHGLASWNWDSPAQVKTVLQLLGFSVASTADEALATIDHPIAELLRRHRAAAKLVSSYGRKLADYVASDGRIYPTWKQLGAASGRMSCSEPNLQQLPRGEYRNCIVAPVGRVLVKADYSQIELRIAAKVSGDKALLEAYQRGEDLHACTARRVLGIEDVTEQHRQLAKAMNFGLLYGMGASGFRRYAKSQYGLDLTEQEAERYREAFFRSYPALAAWHRRVRARRTRESRTLFGRRRLFDDETPDTQRLNTPVQGTGADGLKLALALLWERRHKVSDAFPVLAVHDEIVVEADGKQAGAVAEWLKAAMVDAMASMLDPVPVEVEILTAQTWGGLKA